MAGVAPAVGGAIPSVAVSSVPTSTDSAANASPSTDSAESSPSSPEGEDKPESSEQQVIDCAPLRGSREVARSG